MDSIHITGTYDNDFMPTEQMQMFNAIDPAHRQIIFKGFKDMTGSARVAYLETLLYDSRLEFSLIDHIYSGPKSNRQLSDISYVEFSSAKLAKAALEKLGGKGKEFNVSDRVKIKMKSAITAINLKRNWGIRTAQDLIKKSTLANDKEINIDFKERKITVGGQLAFTQSPNQLRGTFLKPFNSLHFP